MKRKSGIELLQTNKLSSEQELFERFQGRIYRLVFRMTGSAEDARDLTQDIFLNAFKNMNKFRKEAEVYSWLYRIAVNRCIDHIRKRQRHFWHLSGLFRETESQELLEKSFETPEDRMLAAERNGKIQKSLSQLKPEFRAVIILKDLDGLNYREIAGILGCSEGTVASRLNRARKELAKNLEKYL